MLLMAICLVVVKFRDRLLVSKEAAQIFHVETLNLKKLKEGHSVSLKSETTLAALENKVDINRAWEDTKDNIKISAKDSPGQYEWKQISIV